MMKIQLDHILIAGGGGLEICGNGAGQAFPVDFLGGVRDGHGDDHPAGAVPLRPHAPHRHPVLEDRQKEVDADDDGPRGGVTL